VLSNRSIAYGIAKACHAQGAELAFSYVGERFKDRITDFAAEFDSKLVFDCDVGSDEQIERMFKDLSAVWPVRRLRARHRLCAARGDCRQLLSTACRRENYRIAHDISAYSFPGMAKAALPYLSDKAALLTLSTWARCAPSPTTTPWAWPRPAWRPACATWPRPWAAGVRVNGISAGPIKTLAASGIKDFGKLLGYVAERLAAAPQRHHRGRGQRGRLPAERPGLGRDGRDHLRGLRLQPDGGFVGRHGGLKL
jgi:enoyl-[acyl-carrier protein] reductase I